MKKNIDSSPLTGNEVSLAFVTSLSRGRDETVSLLHRGDLNARCIKQHEDAMNGRDASSGMADVRELDREFLRELGRQVRARRTARKLSRRVLSGKSGVSERFIAHLESGEGNISIMRLKAIAVVLDTTVAELSGAVEGPTRPRPKLTADPSAQQPGAIADLYRRADPAAQRAVAELLVTANRRSRAA